MPCLLWVYFFEKEKMNKNILLTKSRNVVGEEKSKQPGRNSAIVIFIIKIREIVRGAIFLNYFFNFRPKFDN